MTIADEARDSALHCEMVKYALRQNKDGVVVSFVVHPNDIPAALSTCHIGSRFMVVLVQIGDDELPIKEAPKAIKTFTSKKPKPEKLDWREVQPAAQAGIRCGEPVFLAFLDEAHRDTFRRYNRDAAATVRFICGVNSRAELGTKHAARVIWHQLDSEFEAWKALERV